MIGFIGFRSLCTFFFDVTVVWVGCGQRKYQTYTQVLKTLVSSSTGFSFWGFGRFHEEKKLWASTSITKYLWRNVLGTQYELHVLTTRWRHKLHCDVTTRYCCGIRWRIEYHESNFYRQIIYYTITIRLYCQYWNIEEKEWFKFLQISFRFWEIKLCGFFLTYLLIFCILYNNIIRRGFQK